ncbi:ribosomal protein S18-alanine N-acetyltransferase [Paenibacillus senegalensis]|uniref:ribosomal protein S18-alanine N-acetyltransferase n=1 Tax=Paenibacillus senegalensis TaxID=1465766 RepID=UPI00028975E4|nr:ribosomal protein S18-alanine N-acetyltransferase [Paenibacillus senegalensis]
MEPGRQTDIGDRLNFRLMKVEDIGRICEIEEEAFPTPWTSAAFYNELVNNHFAHYMVMELDGEIIAYGGMWLIMNEAHVTNIAVALRYRGMKLGERLVRELKRTAAFMGADKMTLEVRESNEVAKRLYRKLGFASSGVRKAYYTDNNEDAIIMWADLPRAASPVKPAQEKGNAQQPGRQVQHQEGAGKQE